MKYIQIVLLLFALLALSSAKNNKGYILKGKYKWQYTMVEDEMMLIKDTTTNFIYGNDIQFKSNYTFSDNRRATCGNDIFYNKTGKYYLNKSNLFLNYTGGKFTDNVGGDSMQVYRKGMVYYVVVKRVPDTIFLRRIKGNSERKVKRN